MVTGTAIRSQFVVACTVVAWAGQTFVNVAFTVATSVAFGTVAHVVLLQI